MEIIRLRDHRALVSPWLPFFSCRLIVSVASRSGFRSLKRFCMDKVLALDDEPGICHLVEKVLSGAGKEAKAVTDVSSFRRLLSEWKPTHLVIDLVMPNVDGVELMRELGEKRVGARVVIMTGAGDRIREAARRVGEENGLQVAGTLDKPFNAGDLLALIDDDSRRAGNPDVAQNLAATETVTVDELRRALTRDELELHYQPKVDVRSRLVVGFEALLRWRHPRYGELLPDAFLPLALQSGLIDEITCWVMRTGARWLVAHEPVVRPILCVNLSAPTLANPVIVETLHAICGEEGIDPDQVVFEITETAAAAGAEDALVFLTRLRLRGFHAAIDNAGTGRSSLTQLARLPFSEMKLDKSFVQDIGGTSESDAIVASLVALAHDLGLVVIAEGVETEAAIAALIEMDCDFMHGYAIAAPMPAKEASDWYARRQRPDDRKAI